VCEGGVTLWEGRGGCLALLGVGGENSKLSELEGRDHRQMSDVLYAALRYQCITGYAASVWGLELLTADSARLTGVRLPNRIV
jgi:hypothetical protein